MSQEHHLPKFFKVYITHHSSHQMQIPIQFLEYLGTRKSGRARLTGSNGETREVELVKDGDEMCFKDGWKVFVKENIIRENDFMFFTYHGKLCFSVRIFENATKCERILPLNVRGNFNQGSGMRDIGRDEKEVGMGSKRSKRSSDRGGSQTAVRDGHLLIPKEEQLEMPSSVVKPSLVVKMTRHNVKRCPLLRIPISFSRENSMCYQHNEKMIIRVEDSSWILNIIQNQNAYVFSAGWSAFVHDNNIKEGDIWVFELIDRLEMVARVSSFGGI